jgi:hydrogenase nickel incorporation protein HypA/HybF
MHELSVSEHILDIALKHGQNANALSVDNIYLVIGQLSSIVDDSIQFYWDIISKDTICSQAILHFNRIQAKLSCLDCHNEYEINAELTPCPLCNSINIKVIAGEEFFLESIDITK